LGDAERDAWLHYVRKRKKRDKLNNSVATCFQKREKKTLSLKAVAKMAAVEIDEGAVPRLLKQS